MEYKEDIEQLVKNTFDNFEADVNPDAWINIQHGLNVPVTNPVSVSNPVSTGVRLTAVSSKFIIMAVTAIVGITTAVIYFSSGNKTVENNPANESEIVQNTLPVAATADAEKTNFSNAENVKKKEQVNFSPNEAINAKNENQQPSRDNNAYVSSTNEDVVVAEMNKKNVTEVPAEKNKDAEMKLQNNPAPAPSSDTDEKKAADNSLKEDEPSDQNLDKDVNASASKEEMSIEEYLGPIVNAITPNGDGKNDAFVIEGKDIKSLKVSIIDRSGKIIHEWNNLHGFWDGKLSNGEPAKAGMYIYNIFAQTKAGTPLSKTGALHLLLK